MTKKPRLTTNGSENLGMELDSWCRQKNPSYRDSSWRWHLPYLSIFGKWFPLFCGSAGSVVCSVTLDNRGGGTYVWTRLACTHVLQTTPKRTVGIAKLRWLHFSIIRIKKVNGIWQVRLPIRAPSQLTCRDWSIRAPFPLQMASSRDEFVGRDEHVEGSTEERRGTKSPSLTANYLVSVLFYIISCGCH